MVWKDIISILAREINGKISLNALNFPTYHFRTRQRLERQEIFDEIRKKWLVCTPEEWVRQHVLKWLIEQKKFPASNMGIEGGLKLNKLQKRTDIVAFKDAKPYLLVECKAPSVKITQKTFDQLFRYNVEVKAPLLMVSNGLQHVFASYKAKVNEIEFLKDLPEYWDLSVECWVLSV